MQGFAPNLMQPGGRSDVLPMLRMKGHRAAPRLCTRRLPIASWRGAYRL
jgi:hypothetical protein